MRCWSITPSCPSTPRRPPQARGPRPQATWLEILPHNSAPLQELIEPLRPALRVQVKLLLGQTIIAAQKRSWDMSFDMIQQFLIRQKRVAKALASGKRPPPLVPYIL
jgi:hypothetical protein